MNENNTAHRIKEYLEDLPEEKIEWIKKAHVGRSGHAKGEEIEERIGKILSDKFKRIYEPYEYVNIQLSKIKKISTYNNLDTKKSRTGFIDRIVNKGCKRVFCGRGKSTLLNNIDKGYKSGKQDDTTDFLYVDENEEKIIGIDVKTEELPIKGRPPNIISAKKLLKLFKEMVENDEIKKIDLLYVGIYWKRKGNAIESIDKILVRDFFSVDVKKIPSINFDAADQVQFHVKDLIEKEIDRKDFIRNFSKKFKEDWKKHCEVMDDKYIKIANELEKLD